MKRLFRTIAILFFLLAVIVSPAPAQTTFYGEIINVNYDFETAFTDLSQEYLNPGDIVEIYKDGDVLTYLEVSETYSAISKLTPIRKKGKYQTKVSLQAVVIGQRVMKVASAPQDKKFDDFQVYRKKLKSKSKPKAQPAMEPPKELKGSPQSDRAKAISAESLMQQTQSYGSSMEDQFKRLSDNYAALSSSFADMSKQKNVLEEVNRKSQAALESALKQITLLESENAMLATEVETLRLRPIKMRNPEQERELVELRNTITVLKAKLRYISEVLEQKLKEEQEFKVE